LKSSKNGNFEHSGLFGLLRDGNYSGSMSSFRVEGSEIVLPEKTWVMLNLSEGEEIHLSPL
jgi:hypothetical protein